MKSKQPGLRTDVSEPNGNIAFPYGLTETVRHYLDSVGILEHADTFKERGVPMSGIITAVCTCILMGSNSMNRCAEWLSNPDIRKEFGFRGKVSQRTVNRAVEILGDHADEILVRMWKGLDSRYRFENTDTNMDGSAVVFNGWKSELGDIGYPRDYKDQSRPQVEFMTAQLQKSKIPFFIRSYRGNTSDAEQYRDSLPSVFDMIRAGSWIIMDNGGASGDILDSIVSSGNKYLTRVKLNISDDKRITERKNEWEYVEDGVCCIKHTFEHSGRTTYLFWSADNEIRSYRTAERNVGRMIESARSFDDGKTKISDFVTIKKNVAADVSVRLYVQTKFGYEDPEEKERMIKETMGIRSGIFKLESSEQLTPSEALNKYRARAPIEHLIHSFKRITGLKPLRVWKESSIRGSMILALLSEAAIAMARYETETKPAIRMKKGKLVTEDSRPSTESMVWSLSHLTVCRAVGNGGRKEAFSCNWNPVSTEVFANIRADRERKSLLAWG